SLPQLRSLRTPYATLFRSNPLDPAPVYRHSSDARANYSHDVASLVITDERKDTQCINGTAHCEVLLDYNEDDIRLWDKTLNQNPDRKSTRLNSSHVKISYA